MVPPDDPEAQQVFPHARPSFPWDIDRCLQYEQNRAQKHQAALRGGGRIEVENVCACVENTNDPCAHYIIDEQGHKSACEENTSSVTAGGRLLDPLRRLTRAAFCLVGRHLCPFYRDGRSAPHQRCSPCNADAAAHFTRLYRVPRGRRSCTRSPLHQRQPGCRHRHPKLRQRQAF